MGRPPCCDKVGVKKGPWTPEEDLLLVSYIQEHGPGNWRSVPTNTGLLRCSKSCRLRWTNYLRPGIKRGNFTPHEEGTIIHLQALLGNKWAAIASYLPQRTDNDIKNYWNTHLKKKIKRVQSALEVQEVSDPATYQFVSRSFSDKNSLGSSSHAPTPSLNQSSSTYASSTENISQLLQSWMRSSPKTNASSSSLLDTCRPMNSEQEGGHLGSNDELESIISFDNLNSIAWDKSSCDSTDLKGFQTGAKDERKPKQRSENDTPLSFFENWLLGESAGQVEEMISAIF